MRVDLKKLEESFINAEKFLRFTQENDFDEFYKIFDILEARAENDVIQSYKGDNDTMRAAIAYLKAIKDIRAFVTNAERDYNTLHNKIHEVKAMASRESDAWTSNNSALNNIVKR